MSKNLFDEPLVIVFSIFTLGFGIVMGYILHDTFDYVIGNGEEAQKWCDINEYDSVKNGDWESAKYWSSINGFECQKLYNVREK